MATRGCGVPSALWARSLWVSTGIRQGISIDETRYETAPSTQEARPLETPSLRCLRQATGLDE
jgi:hypothetical protein